MNEQEKLQEAISVLKTLLEDARMALDNKWDRSDSGFEAQITLIENTLSEIE